MLSQPLSLVLSLVLGLQTVLGATFPTLSLVGEKKPGREVVKQTTAKSTSTSVTKISGSFHPQLPFKVSSHWHNTTSRNVIRYKVGNSYHGFLVKNGQFIAQGGDTWFVYGLFGYVKAILKPANVKYPIWNNRHNGIDFAARYGLPVYAAESGIVCYRGFLAGNTIVLKHSLGYRTTYGHLSTIYVKKGQRVIKGQLIGRVGQSGALNPHLHFEIDQWRGNRCYGINPLRFISLRSAIIPQCDANRFYRGSSNPYLQKDFAWQNPIR